MGTRQSRLLWQESLVEKQICVRWGLLTGVHQRVLLGSEGGSCSCSLPSRVLSAAWGFGGEGLVLGSWGLKPSTSVSPRKRPGHTHATDCRAQHPASVVPTSSRQPELTKHCFLIF